MRAVSFIAATLLCAMTAGCSFVPRLITGSGEESHEVREVASFDSIAVAHSIEARIKVLADEPQKVEVSGDDNIVAIVRTRVSGGKLILDLPPSLGISPRLPLVVTISATALTALDASDSAIAHADKVEGGSVSVASSDSAAVTVDAVIGERVDIAASDSGDLTVESVNCDRLSLAASDSAVLKAGEITAPEGIDISSEDSAVVEAHDISAEDSVSVTVEDSSVAVLDGSAPVLSAALSDSSQLDARDFEAKKVAIVASSSSAAEVCATASIDARLSDSSAVLYSCDPDKVTKTLDDSSTLDEK